MKYSKELHKTLGAFVRLNEERNLDGRLTTVEETRALLDEIERLQAERRWIPVSIPPEETAKHYWCSMFDEHTCKRWQEKRYLFSDGNWDMLPGRITHWMPLPEPPDES